MTKKTNDKMELWNEVETSHSDQLKKVNMRGGFTAIDAHSQIKRATEVWGPMGSLWDVDCHVISESPILVLKVSLRYPYYGIDQTVAEGLVNHRGKVVQFGTCKKPDTDEDAYKKAMTDGTTKCLSLLGFNADVFMGKWDDNKYTAKIKKQEAEVDMSMGGEINGLRKGVYKKIKKLTIKKQAEVEGFVDRMDKTLDNWVKVDERINVLLVEEEGLKAATEGAK